MGTRRIFPEPVEDEKLGIATQLSLDEISQEYINEVLVDKARKHKHHIKRLGCSIGDGMFFSLLYYLRG